MLDIRFIRENPEVVKDSIRRRGLKTDVDRLIDIDNKRRKLIGEIEAIQAERNKIASDNKGDRPSEEMIEQGRILKSKHEALENNLDVIIKDFNELLAEVPNLIAEGTPDGGEESNLEIHKWGEIKSDFEPKDHLGLSEIYDLYDFESGAKVAGAKFYFTKHRAVKLWQAIQKVAQDIIEAEGFELLSVPHMVNLEVAKGTGYMPKGEENQNYIDQAQDLVMIATSEMPITALHSNEVMELKKPAMYASTSPCYRLEAGTYGKFNKGLYRTHQFEKLEMYIFCKPSESAEMLQKILDVEKKIHEALEIPYRITRTASGDMSAPAFEKYDLEYHSPVDKEYREITSCSNCTDYQARNLNIKFRNSEGKLEYVHTLNGTGVVSSRAPIAILENHQTKDGRVVLPKALAKHYGADDL
jgi:seryl-tRNA synthetase